MEVMEGSGFEVSVVGEGVREERRGRGPGDAEGGGGWGKRFTF